MANQKLVMAYPAALTQCEDWSGGSHCTVCVPSEFYRERDKRQCNFIAMEMWRSYIMQTHRGEATPVDWPPTSDKFTSTFDDIFPPNANIDPAETNADATPDIAV